MLVTSLAEVWIEMLIRSLIRVASASLPLRKCGLKYGAAVNGYDAGSHFPCGSVDWNCKDRIPGNSGEWSLPLRKCGLKLCSDIINVIHNRHFPCGSVDWNMSFPFRISFPFCHFPCGSVDWNAAGGDTAKAAFSHFPCGSVDWNIYHRKGRKRNESLPLRKCGLKLLDMIPQSLLDRSHFPCGSVDWNRGANVQMQYNGVTSLAEVWIEIRIRSWPDILIRPSLSFRTGGLKFP